MFSNQVRFTGKAHHIHGSWIHVSKVSIWIGAINNVASVFHNLAETDFTLLQHGFSALAFFNFFERRVIQTDIVQHQRRQPGKQDASLYLLSAKGIIWSRTPHAKYADTLFAQHDGKFSYSVRSIFLVNNSMFWPGCVILHHDGFARIGGPPC
jgi:hypothetical protein